MKQLLKELKWFFEQKIYVAALALTAICGYGYAIVQPIIGIDDTAVELYIEDGLEVVMGRWTIFLINKLFHLSEFSPFMMEVVGVIFLCIAATCFCVLFRRIFGEKIGIVGYTIFSCLFISNPIMSEVYIYYYHDGVDIGFILTALALLLFYEAVECSGKARILRFLGSMLLIWTAIGCYESLMILYIVGLIVLLFLRGVVNKEPVTAKYVIGFLTIGALLVIGAVLLRSLMIQLLTFVFDLGAMTGIKNQRSLLEVLKLFEQGNWVDTFSMLIKRFWVVYYVNALVYMPVTVYVFGVFITGIASLVYSVRKKNFWFIVLFVGMLIAPFVLTVLEVQVTLYRSCQYLPFVSAMGGLLLYWAMTSVKQNKYLSYACIVFTAVLVYNQAAELNKNFYVDYKKYENTKDVLLEIAWEIEKEYGNDVPVVFAGHYDTPYSIVQDSYVSYGSWQYRYIAMITDLVDPHLKEKYFDPHGYSFIGEANNPFIQWGLDAFDGTNRQMMNFLEMHGHSFPVITDKAVLEKANSIAEAMPGWPSKGSIAMQDGYVLVHIQ